MTELTPDVAAELRSILAELKVAAARTSVSLSGQNLLVETYAWAQALNELTTRLALLELPFEVLATTTVIIRGEVPGSVDLTDLDALRVPDSPAGLEETA